MMASTTNSVPINGSDRVECVCVCWGGGGGGGGGSITGSSSIVSEERETTDVVLANPSEFGPLSPRRLVDRELVLKIQTRPRPLCV